MKLTTKMVTGLAEPSWFFYQYIVREGGWNLRAGTFYKSIAVKDLEQGIVCGLSNHPLAAWSKEPIWKWILAEASNNKDWYFQLKDQYFGSTAKSRHGQPSRMSKRRPTSKYS